MDGLAKWLETSLNPPELKHIYDFQMSSTRDEVWVPKLANEGWIVVTADGGKGGKGKGEKLPKLCHLNKITHIILSSTLHHKPVFEKTRCLIAVWNDIVRLPEEPPGSRFSLRATMSGSSVQLVKIELAEQGYPITIRKRSRDRDDPTS